MDPQIKERWVTALRSGDYKQGKGALRSAEPERYCCLGVLCDLYAARGWVKPNPDLWHAGDTTYGFRDETALSGLRKADPSVAVRNWADLSMVTVRIVAELNDDGASFDEIAEYIEASF